MQEELNVFISWSGVRAGRVADALKAWLKVAFPDTQCFLSKDIQGGKRWNRDLSDALQASNFGVLVLTAENKNADWILFEAGALAKQVGESRVVPLLVDIEPKHLSGPLGDFQALRLSDQAYNLLETINASLPDPIAIDELRERFAFTYDRFANRIKVILRESDQNNRIVDSTAITHQMLEEILRVIKSLPEKGVQAPLNEFEHEQFYPTNDRIDLYKFLKARVPMRLFRNVSMPALFEAAAAYVAQVNPGMPQETALTEVARHLISDRPLRDLLGALQKY
jgi:hypothetical protein